MWQVKYLYENREKYHLLSKMHIFYSRSISKLQQKAKADCYESTYFESIVLYLPIYGPRAFTSIVDMVIISNWIHVQGKVKL